MERKLAILVADLAGYTALTEAHGSFSAAQIVDQYLSLVHQSLQGSSRLVERVGDEVVIVAEDASDLVGTACSLRELAFQQENFLAIHAGMHMGEVLEQNGSFFGTTLNLASRIAGYSRGGQILCSSSILEATQEKAATFKPVGEVSFKNLRKKVELFELVAASDCLPSHTDPVCRMLVLPHQALPYWHEGRTYYFCSSQCHTLFTAAPEDYIQSS